ncbi:cell division protein ZapA [Candidatus Desantisbacteria bacterium]|nr:cell division protein ZapA [Candidatus Desantisbacteria bacterium]
MSQYSQRVEIKICGNTYRILGDENPEHIKKISEYVDEKMRAITTASDTVSTGKVAVLTALYIADELFKTKDKTEEKLSSLIKKMESTLRKTEKISAPPQCMPVNAHI